MAPFLAAVAAFALSTGGFLSAFLAFLLFAGTMGGLMLVISLLVGTSQTETRPEDQSCQAHPLGPA